MSSVRSEALPDPTLSKWDYWVLRFCRDAAAITLLVAAPLLQITFFRWLPYAVLLSLILVVLGHALTGWRHIMGSEAARSWHPRNWTRWGRYLAVCYTIFVVWAAFSLAWSPAPADGLRDVVLLIVAPPVTLFLGSELSKTIIAPVHIILACGLALTSLGVISELAGFTTFYTLNDKTPKIDDLNRNVAVLGLLIWPLILSTWKEPKRIIPVALIGLACVTAIMMSKSASAQLMLVISMIGFAILLWQPRLLNWVVLSMVAATLLFPTGLTLMQNALAGSKNHFVRQAHAELRINLWKGYRELAMKNPITGWGLRANRHVTDHEIIVRHYEAMNRRTGFAHTHNLVLELWVDLGIIGFLLFSAILLFFDQCFRALPTWQRSCIIIGVVAVVSHSMTGAAFLQAWWFGGLSMLGVAYIAILFQRRQSI